MSAEHPKEDELQKMLALKRHETPPPPFFKGFSHKVIAGLEAPDPAASLPWWKRLGHDIDSKPVLVCLSAIVVCGLFAAGMIISLRMEPPKKRSASTDDTRLIVTPPANLLADQGMEISPAATSKEAAKKIGEPVVAPSQSPFGEIRIEPTRATLPGAGAPPPAPK